ncbi:MAG: metallophosphoesterase [Anaerolineales bacterium]
MRTPQAPAPERFRILAVSDEVSDSLYGGPLNQLVGQIDLVLGCGDLPADYLEFLVSMLNVPLYYVFGNHDASGWWRANGTLTLEPQGCFPLEGRTANFRNILLAGLGGSIRYAPVARNQFTQREMWSKTLALAPRLWFNRLRYGRFLDIFVSHSPPQGIQDGPDAAHVGFEAFRWLLRWAQPRWHLHGHTTPVRNRPTPRSKFESTEVIFVPPYQLLEWKTGND